MVFVWIKCNKKKLVLFVRITKVFKFIDSMSTESSHNGDDKANAVFRNDIRSAGSGYND